MEQRTTEQTGSVIELDRWRTPVQCPHCGGRRGFKRQCGGGLSDWVWADCDHCNGSGYAQVGPQRADAETPIEITYEQLCTLVAGAQGYVAYQRREQRRKGIGSWAIAAEVDAIARVTADVKSVMRTATGSAVQG